MCHINGMHKTKIIIVGGGFAGLHAARCLGRCPQAEVTLFDRHNHHLFQPMLYQAATAALSPTEIASPIRHVLARYRNITVLQADVTGINAQERLVETESGRLNYDRLILAAGAQNNYFDHDAWQPLAPGLKTVRDALEIRNRVLMAFERAEREEAADARKRHLTFVVVGGGYTGVELAGAIAELARYTLPREFRRIRPAEARILLVEAGPRIMPTMPATLAGYARDVLQTLGVEIRTGETVSAISPTGVSINSDFIPAATVLWAAGTRASPLARRLAPAADAQGRVAVNPDLSLPGYPDVFVVGDMAHFAGPEGEALPAIAPVAFQQGKHAAMNIVCDIEGRPRTPFRYWNKGELAAIGRNRAAGMVGRFRVHGRLAWLLWVFVHIYYLTDFRNRLIVLLQWAWTYIANSRGARLITNSDDHTGKGEGNDS